MIGVLTTYHLIYSMYPMFSLRPLCVLCVSVVNAFLTKIHHRDTEDAEGAQRVIGNCNSL
jgi:hypothetical protein